MWVFGKKKKLIKDFLEYFHKFELKFNELCQKVELLETNIRSVRGLVNAKVGKLEAREPEPSLTEDEKEFLKSTVEYQEMTKAERLNKVEE